MYWADEFAESIITSGKYKPYWIDDMKTPSGRVHVGSVRAVITHELIYRALLDRGVRATFSYVLDDQDPLDSLPAYLDQDLYRKHLGKPLYKIPSPEKGFESYGQRWGKEYITIFNALGVKPEIIWGSQLYTSGKMNEMIRICLDRADEIRRIYKSLYGEVKPEDWFPFSVECERCGRLVTTAITDWDGKEVTYECLPHEVDWTEGCGHQGQVSPFSGNGKLPWKVEWACKWKVIGVTIEGAGKDHMTKGGSHDVAKLICKRIIDYPIPFAFLHEFFLVGGRKMSSSKGMGSSAKDVAALLPPYLIRFMIARIKYNRAIDFDPGGMTVPDLFDDYDETASSYWDGKNPRLARIFELSQVKGRPPQKHYLPRFRDVATAIQYPEIDPVVKFASAKGSALTQREMQVLDERIRYAKIWLDGYAPQEVRYFPTQEIPEAAKRLGRQERVYLKSVVALLAKRWDEPESLQQELYQAAKQMSLPPPKAFGAIYTALIGKDHGPRAAWLLLQYKDLAVKRLKMIKHS